MDHKFVFICGMHKSGTSVFFKSMKTHPDISGHENTGVPEDEGQHLQTVYRAAIEHGGMGKFGFDPEARLTEESPLITPENREKLLSEWAKWWNMDKPVLLEKSPPNIIRTRFLQAMFPGAYFILLMRHPLANTFATKKGRLTLRNRGEIEEGLRHWLLCHDIFMEDKPHIEKLLTIKYEDFVKDPNGSLKDIYAFLDIEYQPSPIEIRPNVNDKYFGMWQEFSESMVNRGLAKSIIDQHEEHTNRYGYSLVDLERTWEAVER